MTRQQNASENQAVPQRRTRTHFKVAGRVEFLWVLIDYISRLTLHIAILAMQGAGYMQSVPVHPSVRHPFTTVQNYLSIEGGKILLANLVTL